MWGLQGVSASCWGNQHGWGRQGAQLWWLEWDCGSQPVCLGLTAGRGVKSLYLPQTVHAYIICLQRSSRMSWSLPRSSVSPTRRKHCWRQHLLYGHLCSHPCCVLCLQMGKQQPHPSAWSGHNKVGSSSQEEETSRPGASGGSSHV